MAHTDAIDVYLDCLEAKIEAASAESEAKIDYWAEEDGRYMIVQNGKYIVLWRDEIRAMLDYASQK